MATTTYSAPTVSVAAIGGRTDSSGEAVADYTAEEARMLTEILEPGYLRPAEAWQVTAQAAPNMSVKVGSGSAKADHYIVEGQVAGQGKYIVRLDATSVNLTVPAADSSQTRTDEIYLVVLDNSYDATLRGIPQLGYRRGDLGGAAPGPDDAWEAYALLATITVGPGVTEITNNEIVDERSAATLVQSLLAVDTSNLVTKDLINAKGDLYVGTGNNTVGRLGVGSNGQVLTADSTQTSGVKWQSRVPAVVEQTASPGGTVGGLGAATSTYGPLNSNANNEIGTTFVAPPSGAVFVTLVGEIDAYHPTSSTVTYCTWEMRTGGTIGSGTVVVEADDANSISCFHPGLSITNVVQATNRGSTRAYVSGLTAGSTYNLRTLCRALTSGTTIYLRGRRLIVEPV